MLVALAGCGGGDDDQPVFDGGGNVDAYPAPRSDLVPSVGTAGAVDIATWNVENFPMALATPRLMADLIESLDLDIVIMEEVEDIASFDQLVARLPDRAGLLSTHTYGNGTYQKIGFIYRTDSITLSNVLLLFISDGFDFPRPPMQVTVSVDDGVHPAVDFLLIGLHFKAGTAIEDRDRREAANLALEGYVRNQVETGDEDEIIIAGDFNEVLTTSAGQTVMAPWLNAPGSYTVRTSDLASAGEASFIPSQVILDHVITTAALANEIGAGATVIPLIHQEMAGYQVDISDHLPVVLSIPILQ